MKNIIILFLGFLISNLSIANYELIIQDNRGRIYCDGHLKKDLDINIEQNLIFFKHINSYLNMLNNAKKNMMDLTIQKNSSALELHDFFVELIKKSEEDIKYLEDKLELEISRL